MRKGVPLDQDPAFRDLNLDLPLDRGRGGTPQDVSEDQGWGDDQEQERQYE